MALLTTDDVVKVLTKLTKAGTKANTLNFKVQDFKRAIRTAFERGIIERKVGLPVKGLPTADSDRRGELVGTLIGSASEEWKGAILVAAHTGSRLSNTSQLSWSIW